MSRRFDCSIANERTRGLREAVNAVSRGHLVVLPTDTVYGVGCDAFQPEAVKALLNAKGRGRDMPPPVLVGSVRAAEALIDDLGAYGQELVDTFWPGPLTIVCKAGSSLAWDLGETKGTVAVRMPLHELALDLLKRTGPMAVSSANISGSAPARTAEDAEEQLGDAIDVCLDDGPSGDGKVSSIVDLTGPVPRLLRAGAISDVRLREVCGVLLTPEDEDRADAPQAADEAGDAEAAEPKTSEPESAEQAEQEAGEPEASEPESAEEGASEPETVEPETAAQESGASKASEPEASKPKASKSKASKSKAKPKVSESEADGQGASE